MDEIILSVGFSIINVVHWPYFLLSQNAIDKIIVQPLL